MERCAVADRGELRCVAHQDQLRRMVVQQLGHQRGLDHGRFVDDDRALEIAHAAECGPVVQKLAVDRAGLESGRLAQPGGRLSGGGQKDDLLLHALRDGLDDRRLAGASAAGDNPVALAHGGRDGFLL